jgi:hypothetical protein
MLCVIALLMAFLSLFFGAPIVGHAGHDFLAFAMLGVATYVGAVTTRLIIGVKSWSEALLFL